MQLREWATFLAAMAEVPQPERITFPLQFISAFAAASTASEGSGRVTTQTIRAAMTAVSVVPIACVYPFLQKYFVKGMTLGAVKG